MAGAAANFNGFDLYDASSLKPHLTHVESSPPAPAGTGNGGGSRNTYSGYSDLDMDVLTPFGESAAGMSQAATISGSAHASKSLGSSRETSEISLSSISGAAAAAAADLIRGVGSVSAFAPAVGSVSAPAWRDKATSFSITQAPSDKLRPEVGDLRARGGEGRDSPPAPPLPVVGMAVSFPQDAGGAGGDMSVIPRVAPSTGSPLRAPTRAFVPSSASSGSLSQLVTAPAYQSSPPRLPTLMRSRPSALDLAVAAAMQGQQGGDAAAAATAAAAADDMRRRHQLQQQHQRMLHDQEQQQLLLSQQHQLQREHMLAQQQQQQQHTHGALPGSPGPGHQAFESTGAHHAYAQEQLEQEFAAQQQAQQQQQHLQQQQVPRGSVGGGTRAVFDHQEDHEDAFAGHNLQQQQQQQQQQQFLHAQQQQQQQLGQAQFRAGSPQQQQQLLEGAALTPIMRFGGGAAGGVGGGVGGLGGGIGGSALSRVRSSGDFARMASSSSSGAYELSMQQQQQITAPSLLKGFSDSAPNLSGLYSSHGQRNAHGSQLQLQQYAAQQQQQQLSSSSSMSSFPVPLSASVSPMAGSSGLPGGGMMYAMGAGASGSVGSLHHLAHSPLLGPIPGLPPVSPVAHGAVNGPASKTKVCRFYLGRNNNHFGKTCSFVHPCRNLLIEGHCKHGRRCTDDHVCREHLWYGDGHPQSCKLGDQCRNIHIKQDVDRAALIDMFRDWIAVKHHEQAAQTALGSSAYASAVVQTEVMVAAHQQGMTGQRRMCCPFWYEDTMAGCKAGPECIFEHTRQFQLPTRPMPSHAQLRFAEKAWERRFAQEASGQVGGMAGLSMPTNLTSSPPLGGLTRGGLGGGSLSGLDLAGSAAAAMGGSSGGAGGLGPGGSPGGGGGVQSQSPAAAAAAAAAALSALTGGHTSFLGGYHAGSAANGGGGPPRMSRNMSNSSLSSMDTGHAQQQQQGLYGTMQGVPSFSTADGSSGSSSSFAHSSLQQQQQARGFSSSGGGGGGAARLSSPHMSRVSSLAGGIESLGGSDHMSQAQQAQAVAYGLRSMVAAGPSPTGAMDHAGLTGGSMTMLLSPDQLQQQQRRGNMGLVAGGGDVMSADAYSGFRSTTGGSGGGNNGSSSGAWLAGNPSVVTSAAASAMTVPPAGSTLYRSSLAAAASSSLPHSSSTGSLYDLLGGETASAARTPQHRTQGGSSSSGSGGGSPAAPVWGVSSSSAAAAAVGGGHIRSGMSSGGHGGSFGSGGRLEEDSGGNGAAVRGFGRSPSAADFSLHQHQQQQQQQHSHAMQQHAAPALDAVDVLGRIAAELQL